jgi:hypothetical protein
MLSQSGRTLNLSSGKNIFEIGGVPNNNQNRRQGNDFMDDFSGAR